MRVFINCLLLGFAFGGAYHEPDCPDDDLTLDCTDFCLSAQSSCRELCSDNSTCSKDCDEIMMDCLNHCPCRSECPGGCDGCLGEFCQCHDGEESSQYLECKDHYDLVYNLCLFSCSAGDFACNGNCFREYTNNLELCPCQSGCPNGCPCEVYECPTTTTTEISTTTTASTTTSTTTATTTTTTTTSTTTTKTPLPATEVLVLNTHYSVNVPIITNAAGRQDRNFYFLYGEETEVKYSCSMTWKNELFVFGGKSKTKQISKLMGCQLKSIGQLAFNHVRGACSNVGDEKLYLCFNDVSGHYNKCRVATSPTGVFEEINSSSHDHRVTRIAASEDDILALGSYSPNHKKAEILRTDRNTWSTINDYSDSITVRGTN